MLEYLKCFSTFGHKSTPSVQGVFVGLVALCPKRIHGFGNFRAHGPPIILAKVRHLRENKNTNSS